MKKTMRMIWLAALAAFAVHAQIAEKANLGYKTIEGRERVAKTLLAADRDARQRPEGIVEAMGIKPGMTVADIGTGAGYMLPFLSRAAGAGGKVLAEDVFTDFLDKAKARAEAEKLTNVSFIQGAERTPNLPEGAVDVALALDSYHHYNYPADMLAAIKSSLKPGGRLVIVEFYKREGAMPNGNALEHIRIDQSGLIDEVKAAGFRLESTKDHVPGSQYIAVFAK